MIIKWTNSLGSKTLSGVLDYFETTSGNKVSFLHKPA